MRRLMLTCALLAAIPMAGCGRRTYDIVFGPTNVIFDVRQTGLPFPDGTTAWLSIRPFPPWNESRSETLIPLGAVSSGTVIGSFTRQLTTAWSTYDCAVFYLVDGVWLRSLAGLTVNGQRLTQLNASLYDVRLHLEVANENHVAVIAPQRDDLGRLRPLALSYRGTTADPPAPTDTVYVRCTWGQLDRPLPGRWQNNRWELPITVVTDADFLVRFETKTAVLTAGCFAGEYRCQSEFNLGSTEQPYFAFRVNVRPDGTPGDPLPTASPASGHSPSPTPAFRQGRTRSRS